MSRSIRKRILFVLTVFIVIGAACVGNWGYREYERQKTDFEFDVSRLENFDENASHDAVLRKLGLSAPVSQPKISFKEAQRLVESQIADIEREQYSRESLASQCLSTIQTFKPAVVGGAVKFRLNDNRCVEGIYWGSNFEDKKGRLIKVDDTVVAYDDVNFSDRYLFDEKECDKIVRNHIDSLERSFESEKRAFLDKARDRLYAVYGYSKAENGKWMSEPQKIKYHMMLARISYENEKSHRIRKIREEYPLLNLTPNVMSEAYASSDISTKRIKKRSALP